MPIPETITPEDLARWDKSWEAFDPQEKGLPAFVKRIPGFKERAWYTGEWLGEQLAALGCPDEDAEAILIACGQRQAAAPDPWICACEALEDYRQGILNTKVPTLLYDPQTGTMRYVSDGNRQQT